jgi:haloacetate dehalogenase
MFESFTSHTIPTGNGIEIAAWVAGSGTPLLLLHGFPQTHVCWHKIAPALAERFTVVATDLRGYGRSSKPPGGGDHASYSKRAMANDQVAVMRALGFARFCVAGHDRGGRVAHRMALDHPQAIERIAVLDIAPTSTMYAATNREFAEAYYHWFFLIQPFDLPERLIGAERDYFLRRTLASWCKIDGALNADALARYEEAFRLPGAIHAMCEDYRAAASIDIEHDLADERTGRRVAMPLLALWGSRGTVARQFDVITVWKEKSASYATGKALDCGHFLPEERPEETLAALLDFFLAGPESV